VTTKAKIYSIAKISREKSETGFLLVKVQRKGRRGTIGNATFPTSLLVDQQISREFIMDITNLQVRPQMILLSNYQKDQNRTNRSITNVAEFNGRIEQ
jgi:parvulin-like peptidyl-prolyl isomerase